MLGEHAATTPFLAIDLLSKAYRDGDMVVLYRHSLESFIYSTDPDVMADSRLCPMSII